MAGAMSHVKLLVGLFIAQAALAQVQHTSQAETDRFLLCARSTFHKPVYMTVVGPWFDAAMKCSSDRDEVIRELQEREIPAFESDSAILLLPPEMRPDIGITDRDGHQVKWHKFAVDIHVGNLKEPLSPGSRPLTKDEQNRIAKVILEQALTPPLVPAFAEVDGDTATMNVDLLLDAHYLTPDIESVVGVLGAGGDARLVYGDLTRGQYRMLWDTPLLGVGVWVSYEDVDGDRTQEIVAQWSEVGGNVSFIAMAVFNRKGDEVTRQEECFPRPLREESAQFACPIWGADVELEKTSSGKYDILDIPNDQLNLQDAERYTLVNGHYSLPIPVLTAVTPTHFSNRMVNGTLTLTGRNFIRDSEIRFIQTSGESPGHDRPGEVRVKAGFVSPTELKARVSDVLSYVDSVGEWKVRIQNTSGHSESLVVYVEKTH